MPQVAIFVPNPLMSPPIVLRRTRATGITLARPRLGRTRPAARAAPLRWEKLDSVVAEHIEHRLLQHKRLEQILSRVFDRRKERAERRTAHIAELRKRAAEEDAKLKRLYDAIENGIADVGVLQR